MVKILLLCTLAAYPDWTVPNDWKVDKINAVTCECADDVSIRLWPAADPCERTIVHLSKEAEIGEQIKLPPGCLHPVQSVSEHDDSTERASERTKAAP